MVSTQNNQGPRRLAESVSLARADTEIVRAQGLSLCRLFCCGCGCAMKGKQMCKEERAALGLRSETSHIRLLAFQGFRAPLFSPASQFLSTKHHSSRAHRGLSQQAKYQE